MVVVVTSFTIHITVSCCVGVGTGTSAVSQQFTAAASRAKIQLRKYLGTGIRNKQL